MRAIPRWNSPGLRDGLWLVPASGSDVSGGKSWPARRLDSGEWVQAWLPPYPPLADPIYRARWLRQALAATRLDSLHLVPLQALGGHADRLFLIEEEPACPTLARQIQTGSTLEIREAVVTGLQVARALRDLHAEGFAHGHVDLDHLVRDPDGYTRLLGQARVASPPPLGTGSPGATLPVLPDPDSVRRDLHGLGIVLQKLLVGLKPDSQAGCKKYDQLPQPLRDLLHRLLDDGGEPGTAVNPGNPIRSAVEAVSEIEAIIGAPRSGEYLPREEVIQTLQAGVQDLESPREVRWKRWAERGFFGLLAALVVLSLLMGLPFTAIGWALLGLLTLVARLAARGLSRGDDRWYGLAAFMFGGTWSDRLTALAGLVLAVTAAAAAGMLGVVIAFGIVAGILAVAELLLLDRPIQRYRHRAHARLQPIVHHLRMHGLDELDVRRVVLLHADPRARSVYPLLFGDRAARRARQSNTAGLPHRGWFDPSLWSDRAQSALESRLNDRMDLRDLKLLEAVEERRLESQGVPLVTARRRARRIAQAMVARGRALRPPRPAMPEIPTPLLLAILQAAEAPELVLLEHEEQAEDLEKAATSSWVRAWGRLRPILEVLLGPRARFLMGAFLLAGCLAWVGQNRLWTAAVAPSEAPPAEAGN